MQISDKYDLGQTIGYGAFSEVKIGTVRDSGEKFAVKIIDKAKCKGKEGMIDTEVSILKKVQHENIIRLYEMFECETKIYLVMELVTGGELFDEIVSRGKYNEREAARITFKILTAVEYLHKNGIVHRDLKPENLLLSEKSKTAKVMISDFGLSKIYNEEIAMKTACGTPGYVAPEVLRRQGYGREVDLWSIGVITYILLSGYPPFYDANNVELFKKIMSGRYEFDRPWWDNISDKAKDFIRKLLVLDPRQRFTTQDALKHPFITSNMENPQPIHLSASDPVLNSAMQSTTISDSVKETTKPIEKLSTGGKHQQIKVKENTGRPISVKTPIDDSGLVTSNETLAKEKASEKTNKKPTIFGHKISGLTTWFRGGAKSSHRLEK